MTKDFYMGVDVAYVKLDGASTPTGLTGTAGALFPANTNTLTKFVGSDDKSRHCLGDLHV